MFQYDCFSGLLRSTNFLTMAFVIALLLARLLRIFDFFAVPRSCANVSRLTGVILNKGNVCDACLLFAFDLYVCVNNCNGNYFVKNL